MLQTLFFFFNDTATTEIYTLSLHDALPISPNFFPLLEFSFLVKEKIITSHFRDVLLETFHGDRKSTRLNSSHSQISYAVFCLKKKRRYYIAHIEHHPAHLSNVSSDTHPTVQ